MSDQSASAPRDSAIMVYFVADEDESAFHVLTLDMFGLPMIPAFTTRADAEAALRNFGAAGEGRHVVELCLLRPNAEMRR